MPESLLAKLYRSTAAEARLLSLPLSEPDRARLALFCAARVHLRDLARTVAATCEPASLMRHGGECGRVLWEEAMRPPQGTPVFRPPRKGVTLAGSSRAA